MVKKTDILKSWHPKSWTHADALQLPEYQDIALQEACLEKLQNFPPLVTSEEIDALRNKISSAAFGASFLLQGGDCAESFQDCREDIVQGKVELLTQMALILEGALHKPVIKLGRLAGQYAKPRTSEFEVRGATALPSYRGDIINDIAFSAEGRQADPLRMLQAYHCSSLTLNWIRNSAESFFISHEALLLGYESALTRPVGEQYYNLGVHFLWLGERTRSSLAHIEYLRGIANPLGIKVGPQVKTEELVSLIETLNPQNRPGRITLITRLGAAVADILPNVVRAVQRAGLCVTWSCDPMHGNTFRSQNGWRTRHFTDIYSEIERTYAIHCGEKSLLGGVHLELTGELVTECLGGGTTQALSEEHLGRNYQTKCDPRLNRDQAMELSRILAQLLGR